MTDFAISSYIVDTGVNRTPKEQKIMVEEMYKKLEKWIFENIAQITLEDEPEEDRLEPDTNDPGLFPAEGGDLGF